LRGIILLEPSGVTVKGYRVDDFVDQADDLMDRGFRVRLGLSEPDPPSGQNGSNGRPVQQQQHQPRPPPSPPRVRKPPVAEGDSRVTSSSQNKGTIGAGTESPYFARGAGSSSANKVAKEEPRQEDVVDDEGETGWDDEEAWRELEQAEMAAAAVPSPSLSRRHPDLVVIDDDDDGGGSKVVRKKPKLSSRAKERTVIELE
jgi:hypothetical protein